MDRVNLHCYTVIEYQHQERQSKIETVKLNYYTVQADLLDCKKLSFKDRKYKNRAKLNCYTVKEQLKRRKRVKEKKESESYRFKQCKTLGKIQFY